MGFVQAGQVGFDAEAGGLAVEAVQGVLVGGGGGGGGLGWDCCCCWDCRVGVDIALPPRPHLFSPLPPIPLLSLHLPHLLPLAHPQQTLHQLPINHRLGLTPLTPIDHAEFFLSHQLHDDGFGAVITQYVFALKEDGLVLLEFVEADNALEVRDVDGHVMNFCCWGFELLFVIMGKY